MKRLLTAFLIAACAAISLSLTAQEQKGAHSLKFIVTEKGDTIFIDDLPPAYKFVKPPKGRKGKKWREYYRLVHNFAKAYPYALVAKEIILEVDEHIVGDSLTQREKNKYINRVQDRLFETFEQPLKNLTITQGSILLRLIDRETGLTPYYILKNYKGAAAAGFWQGIAKLFGSDMKRPYSRLNEDKEIEELVQIYQRGEFNYLYAGIFGSRPPEPVVRAKCDYIQK